MMQILSLSWILSLYLIPPIASQRYDFDERCPVEAKLDPPSMKRDPTSRRAFKTIILQNISTWKDCSVECCKDWNCQTFSFNYPTQHITLTGQWINEDSLRGDNPVTMEQDGKAISAIALDPKVAYWANAKGLIINSTHLWMSFDGSSINNRTGILKNNNHSIVFSRVSFDPKNFTQVFVKKKYENPTCTLMDDIPPLVHDTTSSRQTGVRSFLPVTDPPFPKSMSIKGCIVHSKQIFGVNGDEFPITWAADGNQYTGAGDNTQKSGVSTPMSFFKVMLDPTNPSYPDKAFKEMGKAIPINGPEAKKACPVWHSNIANLKSSGVLSIDGVLYWAVSCFNYGDDSLFNRQRYGPAWIVTSKDGGLTWNQTATPTDFFTGRLAAPRFIQFGQEYSLAPDNYVYAYFPGTEGGAAFFSSNDAIWLGRVKKTSILHRNSWEFYVGHHSNGEIYWSKDDSIAQHIFEFPLHTSTQQVNYHPTLDRYIFANWAWVSMDGNPKPDHSSDEKHGRTARQRTQLTLFEGPKPWGPFSVFYRNDNWHGEDNSTGAYTPVFPPAWMKEKELWMVSTQCCGIPQFPPTNHYSFNAQRVTWD